MRSTFAVSAVVFSLVLFAGLVSVDPADAQDLSPVTVGSPMPDFTLPAFQGGEVSVSRLRGKNVLLIFPRGRSRADAWCHICNYQHSELVDYELAHGLRQQANLEILFVLPYGRAEVQEWMDVYAQQLQDLEDWKNPDPATLDDAGRNRMQFARQAFPKIFTVTPERVPGPFPILIDGDRAVSRGLGFFTNEWGGSQAEQNVPAILIIDPEGTLQFKYLSQNTMDRPPLDYLLRVIGILAGTGE
jgi:peroxiredoxin